MPARIPPRRCPIPAFLSLDSLFIAQAWKDPPFFISVILTVVVSVVLHELGHAVAAIWQGDETPRLAGHLTLDPLVHMGGVSLVFLFLAGIAWGQTPVTPSRFRSRYGDALVSLAGPLVNLTLALLGLTVLGIWLRIAGPAQGAALENLQLFLEVFGIWNIVLFLFNLLPIPPLDGSSVLASFFPPYARIARDPHNQGVFFAAFILVFVFAGRLFTFAAEIATAWVGVVAGQV